MKKIAILALVLIMLAMFGSCGRGTTVEGTWYSVTDATMYNFEDGEISCAGQPVGQYENEGDSVVISLITDGTNQQLYITKMDDIEVLADVSSGEGTVYFCKGLENAQKLIEDQQALIEKAEDEKHKASLEDRSAFEQYLKENLYGTWIADNQEENITKIQITADYIVETDKWGDEIKSYILEDPLGRTFPVVSVSDGLAQAELYVSENKSGENAGYIYITVTDKTYSDNQVQFYSWTFTKKE